MGYADRPPYEVDSPKLRKTVKTLTVLGQCLLLFGELLYPKEDNQSRSHILKSALLNQHDQFKHSMNITFV